MSSHDVRVFTQTVEGNQVRIKTPRLLTVRAASTANVSDLTAASVSVDGVTCVAGDIVLLKNQSTASQNGIYAFGDVTSGTASLTRVWPMESGVEGLNGTQFFVQSGTVNGGEIFYLTNAGTVTIGTTNLTFSQLADTADGVPYMQAVDATLASGTVTINTNIVVASTSEVIPLVIGAITGSTNFASLGELKASRVNGAAGVGTVVIQAYTTSGALDSDAAGAIRVVILTPLT